MKNEKDVVIKQDCHSRGMTSLFNNGGFTLIELLVVVLIIGILSAVAVPQYQKAVKKAYYQKMLPILASVVAAQKVYYLAHGEYAQDMTQLDMGSFTETCAAEDSRMRAVDIGYKIGEYCVYLTDTEHSSGPSTGVLIGLATEKFGLTGYKAHISGYEYLFSSHFSNRPAKKTYCRAQAGIGTDSHCTGKLVTNNSYGAWFEMD